MFPRAFLNELRERLPIASYVHERVSLKKAGRNFKGLCPFHHEKTPSFTVSAEKNIFHCFGCGAGGDVIQFAMRFEGLSFPDAVRSLAQRAGMSVPDDPRSRQEQDRAVEHRKQSLRLMHLACEWFQSRLEDAQIGKRAREYLSHRGLDVEYCRQHLLGFADEGWDALTGYLTRKKVPMALAVEVGLVRPRKDGGYYDFFRNRVIFPVCSPRGEVIAFGGRTLDAQEPAKYLNSPDSPIFHKSQCVYGLNWALDAIRERDQVLVVEGYMDAIALAQAGVRNVVAPMGTALTSEQIALLSRHTRNLVVVFDGDAAGVRAGARALPLFLEVQLAPRAVRLPDGDDPDTFVRAHGSDAFRVLLAEAPTLFEAVIDEVARRTGIDTAGKLAAMQEILPVLCRIADPVMLSTYIQATAKRFAIEERAVRAAVAKAGKHPVTAEIRATLQPTPPKRAIAAAPAELLEERMLMELMLRHPKRIAEVFSYVSVDDFEDARWKEMVQLLWLEFREQGQVDVAAWLSGLAESVAAPLRTLLLAEEDPDLQEQQMMEDCIARMRVRTMKRELAYIHERIVHADAAGDAQQVAELLRQKQHVVERIRSNHGKTSHA